MGQLDAGQRDLAWPPRQTCRECFAEERLGRGDPAIWAKQEIHRLAVPVDGPIKEIPLATDVYISLVHPPGRIHWSCEAIPTLLELWYIASHPAENRRVRHDNAALGHHRHEIPGRCGQCRLAVCIDRRCRLRTNVNDRLPC